MQPPSVTALQIDSRQPIDPEGYTGFVDGSIIKPSNPDDPLLKTRERCDDMVVSWIHVQLCKPFNNAYEVWNELRGRLAEQNRPRIFRLKRALANLSQGNDLVIIYDWKLKLIWDELALHYAIP
ncbi:hypothetical protein SADUNF_Sadunf02G0117700 [Salix dunnii]|uniref:Retrotransposon gag domain-containing protein n=1 Tax=Salix dunnii TaxID=1413687 RepID=A0A835THN7_9ROSI|nr:hypothetical protein SADUNF_Sadunf02G0117700 [Salix dunnii]